MKEDTILQTELDFYTSHKDDYVKLYLGQFLLIKEKMLVKGFTSEAEAYRAGLELFGNEPFLIKQVTEGETSVSYPALTVGVINMHV